MLETRELGRSGLKAVIELGRMGMAAFYGLGDEREPEMGVDTIRRAFQVHQMAALQYEYSLWSRDPETDILPLCRELDIGLVAYSPLGRGFLTGQIRSINDLAADDFQRHNRRFGEENFPWNLDLVAQIKTLSAAKKCTPSQLALAWVLARGKGIVPMPGTRRLAYLKQNPMAAQVIISQEDMNQIETAFPCGIAVGERYSAAGMTALGR